MYIRKKRAFRDLVGLLRSIENDPEDIESIRQVNHRLIQLVLGVEEAIGRHRASKKDLRKRLRSERPSKVEANELRRRIKRIDGYIKAQQDQMYVWKCFGDSLAFAFLDPFSIKHMFFDTADYKMKQDAGTLGGKEGLTAEIDVLEDALDNRVPAVLCDLTNTLRFGDICLLGASDPFPIEVKTNPRLNQRGKRQKAKLDELHSFLEQDNAIDFRGHEGKTIRVNSGELSYHSEALNSTISRSYLEGFATCSPEDGFCIVCIKTEYLSNKSKIGEIFDSLDLDTPEVFNLNHFKNERSWAFYLPFMLTIRDPEHVLDFLEGRIYILVFIEGRALTKRFEQDGWEVRYRADAEYAIQCLHSETGAYYGVSSSFIARAAFELLSFDSIVSTQRVTPALLQEMSEQATNEIEPMAFRQRLIDKFGEGDEWIERILSAQINFSGDR